MSRDTACASLMSRDVNSSFSYLVVLEVISLECHREGDADGQVGEDAEGAVGHGAVEAEAGAVGDLMNG